LTEPDNNFALIEKYFDQFIDCDEKTQNSKIGKLVQQGILNNQQAQALKSFLKADKNTQIETSIQSVSDHLIDEINSIELTHEQKQIGPYLIEKSIGEGGMGQVYLAHRNDGQFEQHVAIKLPHFNIDKNTLKRFENERQILAQLTHPNIAHLLDGGTTNSNQPYLVMEYVQGKNIDKYCIDKLPTLKQRINLIIQICDAVAFAHQKLVLHRDLKPQNILVTTAGQVKLLDFGIAKLFNEEDATLANKTATQIMTRNYASPEQIQGKMVSTHSDLFSLAVIAYELLTGFHPYKNHNSHEREKDLISGKIIRITHLTEESPVFPELSQLSTSKLVGDLENILNKALATEPEKRYANVQAFADDLNNFIHNKPVTARKPSFIYTFSKLLQRNKIASLAIILTLATLVFSTVYSINKANIAYKEATKSKKIASIMQDMFKKARPAKGASEVMAYDLLDHAVKQIKVEMKAEPEIKYYLLTVIFRSYAFLGKMNNLKIAMDGVYSNCVHDLSKTDDLCQNILIYKAYLQHRLGRDDLAVKYYQQAEDIAKNEKPMNKKMVIKIINNAFGPLYNTGQQTLIMEKLELAIKLYKQSPNPKKSAMITFHNDLAMVALSLGEYQKAKTNIDEIFSIISKNNLSDSEAMASNLNLYATYLNHVHQPVSSLVHFQRAIAILNKVYQSETQLLGVYQLNYAQALFRAGKIETAIVSYKKAIQFYNNYGNGLSSGKLNAQIKLARTYVLNGKLDLANELMDEINNIGLENLSANKPEQCDLTLLQASIALHSKSISSSEKWINQYKVCVDFEAKEGTAKQLYWDLLNAHLAVINQQKEKSKAYLKKAQGIFEKYPEDYLGLKYMYHFVSKQIGS